MIKTFAIWRLGIFLLGIWGTLIFQNIPDVAASSLRHLGNIDYFKSLLQWDGGHYLSIAKFGYQFASDYAFFPLYPLIIKSLSSLIGTEIFWGLLISNASFFIFLALLYKVLAKKYSKKIAFNVFITYLFFPTAFFATSFYSESFFLLLALLSIIAIDNKKYLHSSILISLASLTRPTGSLLIISYFYKILISENKLTLNRNIIYPILSITGIALYTFYLLITIGNPVEFSSVQVLWGREVVNPVSTALSSIWNLLFEFKNPIDYLDLFITSSFLAILFLGIRKIPPYLWIFSTLTILIPASSGTLTSMPRYVLSSIGAFIIFGIYLEEKPFLKMPFWTISLIIQIILYVRFLNGFWVA